MGNLPYHHRARLAYRVNKQRIQYGFPEHNDKTYN